MAAIGAAWQNGYAERLMRTSKEEEVDLSEDKNDADAVQQIGRFLDEVDMRQQHAFFLRLSHSRRVRKPMVE
jgi:putative transposase